MLSTDSLILVGFYRPIDEEAGLNFDLKGSTSSLNVDSSIVLICIQHHEERLSMLLVRQRFGVDVEEKFFDEVG
jgi:hypothetical protein